MPGNTIKINNADELEWYVGDSKMPEFVELLNRVGVKEPDKAPKNQVGVVVDKSKATIAAPSYPPSEYW